MQLSAPDGDEIEITIFGRGVGECCVLHVGGNRWVVVDTFNHTDKLVDPVTRAKTLVPVARWYLDEIGVGRDRVETIVITHFHRDHYEGLRALRKYYPAARLIVTQVLKPGLFDKIYSHPADIEGLKSFGREIKDARADRSRDPAGMLEYWGSGNTRVYGTGATRVRLTALSPTRGAIDTAFEEIGRYFAAGSVEGLRSSLKDENLCSITIHVEGPGGAHALLCSDLPAEPALFGWHAVLSEPSHHGLPQAQIVKIAHHGSEGADHAPMWERMVDERPLMMVTPFTPQELPRRTDIERLCGRGDVWQATPTSWQTTDEFGYGAVTLPATGFIRARRKFDGSDWRVEFDEPAFHVNSAIGVHPDRATKQ